MQVQTQTQAGTSAEEIAKKYGGVKVEDVDGTDAAGTSTATATATNTATTTPIDTAAIARKYGGVKQTAPNPNQAILDEQARKFPTTREMNARNLGGVDNRDPNRGVYAGEQDYKPLTQRLTEGVGAMKDAAVGTVKAVKSAVMDPLTEEEKNHPLAPALFEGPALSQAVKKPIARMFIMPQLAEVEKAQQPGKSKAEIIGHATAAAIPGVGPTLTHLIDTAEKKGAPAAIGEAGFMAVSGQFLNAVPSLVPRFGAGRPAITERQISAIASRIKSGVGDESVYQVAEAVIPVWQRSAAELGVDLEHGFPTRGVTDTGKRNVRQAGEQAVDIADHAVDITERPFLEVMDQYGDVQSNRVRFGDMEAPQVQQQILDRLEALARENDGINQPLADAMRAAAERVQVGGQTFRGLNELKSLANKKSSAIFDKTGSAQVNSSADVAYAWKALGDTIRSEMYPELSRLSGQNLREAGVLESIAIDARDGLRKNYYKEVLPEQAQRAAQTYFEYLSQGSYQRHRFLAKAFGLNPTPAGEFNKIFRRGIGEAPPMPNSVPIFPGPNRARPAAVAGTQNDLLPIGAADGTEPLLAPPPGTSSAIGEDIFRIQQRADREARSAPPPTIAGEQQGGLLPFEGGAPAPVHYVLDADGKIVGKNTLESPQRTLFADQGLQGPRGQQMEAEAAYWQDMHQREIWRSGKKEPAKGQLDFGQLLPPDGIPGGTRLDFTTSMPDGTMRYHYVQPNGKRFITDRDILLDQPTLPLEPPPGSQQDLFSMSGTTPQRWNPTMRETSTMSDLTAMANEIDQYLSRSNPPPVVRREWEADLAAIRNEIDRRRQANAVGRNR